MSIHPIHGNNRFPPEMTAVTWQQRLDSSHTKEEVEEIARDFLAGLPPEEIHKLPPHCRPPSRVIAEDIAPYALDLVRHECSSPDTAELVHKLARFFSHAATRLAQVSALHHHAGHGDMDEQRSA